MISYLANLHWEDRERNKKIGQINWIAIWFDIGYLASCNFSKILTTFVIYFFFHLEAFFTTHVMGFKGEGPVLTSIRECCCRWLCMCEWFRCSQLWPCAKRAHYIWGSWSGTIWDGIPCKLVTWGVVSCCLQSTFCELWNSKLNCSICFFPSFQRIADKTFWWLLEVQGM